MENKTLLEKIGLEYWSLDYIPQDVHDKALNGIKRDLKKFPEKREEYSKSRAKLDQLDILDYPKIIVKNWNLFEKIVGSKEELERRFKDLHKFRNPVSHHKLDQLDELTKKDAETALTWMNQIMN